MSLIGFDCWWELIKTSLIAACIGVLTIVATLQYYRKHNNKNIASFTSNVSMKGKTVIVTGATSGIGKETTRALAIRGARVIMACRNIELATEVRNELMKAHPDAILVIKKLDVSSEKSLREFAEGIIKTEPKLDVLIHNAGLALSLFPKTNEAGIELTMATNHYGPFILTHLLIDLLKKSKPSRIVIVASRHYKLGWVNLKNMNPVKTFPAAYLYFVTKFANIYFSNELARRLEGSGVTANCLHPGVIDTGIWRSIPFPLNYVWLLVIKGFFKTPEQGAQTTLYAACAEELNGVSGKYFMDCKEAPLIDAARDMERARKMWEESLKIVNLKPTDPTI